MKANRRPKQQCAFQCSFSYLVSPWCHSGLKRVFDIFGAILLLVLLLPMMIAVAVLVKLTSRGAVLFRQRRPGKNGREFTILKFRTMINGRRHEGVRPGITCQATVKFRNEEDLLAPFSLEQVEDVYMKAIMPLKMRMNLEYLQNASFTNDLRILFKTVFRVFNRQEGRNDFLIREYLPIVEQKELLPATVMEGTEYLTVAEETD